MDRYRNRSTITVYVMPDSPSESYLVENTRGDLAQVVFLFVGLLMVYLPVRGMLQS